jgi:hypothetical protein
MFLIEVMDFYLIPPLIVEIANLLNFDIKRKKSEKKSSNRVSILDDRISENLIPMKRQ